MPNGARREYLDMEHGDARTRLHELAANAGVELSRISVSVVHGDAWRSILEQEKLLQADLVVAGKQGRSTMADFLLGSVTRRLMAHSSCDVLVVPRAAAVPGLAPGLRLNRAAQPHLKRSAAAIRR